MPIKSAPAAVKLRIIAAKSVRFHPLLLRFISTALLRSIPTITMSLDAGRGPRSRKSESKRESLREDKRWVLAIYKNDNSIVNMMSNEYARIVRFLIASINQTAKTPCRQVNQHR